MDTHIEYLPISYLDALITNTQGMLDAGNDLLALLEKAKTKPHVLDDASVSRITDVYTEQQQEIKYYQQLLQHWMQDNPTEQQQTTLVEFESKINDALKMHRQIFFITDFLKQHTIDQILKREDAELAIDVLTDKIFPPA